MGEVWITHTELFTLIHIGCSPHHVQECAQHFCTAYPIQRAVVPETADGPGLVMIGQVQAVPGLALQFQFPAVHDFPELRELDFMV